MSGKGDAKHEDIDELVAAMPRLRRYARSLTGSPADADDLLQNTVERAMTRNRPGGQDLLKWLFRVCRNLWIDEVRARDVRRDAAERIRDQAPPPATLPAREPGGALDDVTAAMERLAPEQREVLLLVAVEGFSYREAAELLDIPAGTVMSRLARARAALVRQLDDGA